MIIPSVDLQDKKAVQLKQGRDKILENSDPAGLAAEFNFYSELAVIDLDAAIRKDGVNNEDVIARIAEIADCRAGGGIRSLEKAKRIISLGVKKVIIGTSAFSSGGMNKAFLDDLAGELGREKIIIAVDTYDGEIVTHGWRNKSGIMLSEIASGLEAYASELLFTCVEKEGMLQGAAIDQVRALKTATSLEVTAAGGITTLEEISELSGMQTNCQLGMSIYTGKISLADALLASIDWSAGKVPARLVADGEAVSDKLYADRSDMDRLINEKKCLLRNADGGIAVSCSDSMVRKIRNGKDNAAITVYI